MLLPASPKAKPRESGLLHDSDVVAPAPEARDSNFLVGLPLEEFQFEDGSIWPEEPALSASIIKRAQAIKQHEARGKGIRMLFFPGPNGLAPVAVRRALSIELLQLRGMLVTGAEPHVDGLQLQKVPRMMRIKNMPRTPGCVTPGKTCRILVAEHRVF